MATYEKRGTKTRVKIALQGVRLTRTFMNKADARLWATEQEREILMGENVGVADKTFGQLLEKYGERFDASHRADTLRIRRLVRDDKLSLIRLKDLNSSHIAEWRDRRLKTVSAASVLREWNLMSPACNTAINEWGWLKENPFSKVKRPSEPPSRERRIGEEEIKRVRHVSGYDSGCDTATARVGAAFLFAIETGMRIGEICALRWEHIHFDKHYLEVVGAVGGRKTKNAVRHVSLSDEAERILRELGKPLFDFSSSRVVDALWRLKIRDKALLKNLHFHDTRHEATTRLARKLDVLDLARMLGIGDLKILQVYYNPTATEIAGRLR